jgi:hypothetical protein
MTKRKVEVPYIVWMIIGEISVGRSNRSAIRHYVKRLRKKYKTWMTHTRSERKQLMRAIIQCHGENRTEYQTLFYGRI